MFLFQSFETILKSWSEKQKTEPASAQKPIVLNADETVSLQKFVEVAAALIKM